MTDRYPIFTTWMRKEGFTPEHKFLKDRKFRFDWANVDRRIAVECDGGLWQKGGGRHNRPTGFLRDAEKMNLAVLAGWAVLRITPDMIQKGTAHQLVERALIHMRRCDEQRH